METNLMIAAVTRENRALIECPRCGFQKIVNISKFFKGSTVRRFVYKCKCGNLFGVILEKRNFIRNCIDLNGSIILEAKGGKPQKFKVVVKDLSCQGVKFSMSESDAVSVGSDIVVTFQFDDFQKSFFTKEAIVRNVRGNVVRAEFKTICDHIAFRHRLDELKTNG